MLTLTAPMVKKLDQILAGGGGGGGGSTDLTPVLDAIAAIPAPSGGSVDLTPVLNAVAAVDSKAVALQTSVAAIPTTGGGSTDLTPVLDAIAALPAPGAAGSPIKSIQRLIISATIPINSYVDIAIGAVEPSKTAVVLLQQTNFTAAYAKYSVETNALRLINTSTQYAVSGVVMKLEIIEYV